MPTAKVTKNVSAAIGGGNVLCSTLISIKTKAWLYSFGCSYSSIDDCNNHSWREDENRVKRLGKILKVRTSEEKER